jgi:dephospho-CoA kinase
MRIIGLTGGIGSGKSTVAQYLKGLGAEVIDLDKVGHEIQKKGSTAYEQLVKAFGQKILAADGEIDRAILGKIVFNNQDALHGLNSIMHPAIDKKVEETAKDCRRRGIKVLVMEAAAMMENNRTWQADEIWVTVTPEDFAIERIKERPGYDANQARARIHSQMKNEERIIKADVVIYNDGTLDELKEKVRAEWEKLMKRLEK